jgi:hypothetical protein
MRPRFLSQKIEAKDPEKKMPSTAANAMSRSAKVVRWSEIHLRAHWAFLWIAGTARALAGGLAQGASKRTRLQAREQPVFLLLVAYVRVDEQGVDFGVDVLHHDLEAVEAPRFRSLDVVGKPLDQVLVDDAVGAGEEGEDVEDKVAFALREAFKVPHVVDEIDLFRRPEGCLSVLVEAPDLPPAF